MVLTVENDVFLLGFVGIHHVDLLRDALQLLLGYGVTAVGEAPWEELEGGMSQSQREARGRLLSVCIPFWAPARSWQRGRGAAIRPPSGQRTGALGLKDH